MGGNQCLAHATNTSAQMWGPRLSVTLHTFQFHTHYTHAFPYPSVATARQNTDASQYTATCRRHRIIAKRRRLAPAPATWPTTTSSIAPSSNCCWRPHRTAIAPFDCGPPSMGEFAVGPCNRLPWRRFCWLSLSPPACMFRRWTGPRRRLGASRWYAACCRCGTGGIWMVICVCGQSHRQRRQRRRHRNSWTIQAVIWMRSLLVIIARELVRVWYRFSCTSNIMNTKFNCMCRYVNNLSISSFFLSWNVVSWISCEFFVLWICSWFYVS